MLTGTHDVLGFDTHDTTSPATVGVLVLVEGSHHGGLQLVKVLLVSLVALGDSQAGGGLLVDELSEAGFGLDDAVRNFHLAAQSRHPADSLDWVNIVGDDDELGLLVLNQGGDVVETEFQDSRGLGVNVTTLRLGFSRVSETLFLLGASLRLQLLQEADESLELFLIDGVLELGNGRRNFQTLEQDTLLALNTDVLRPLGEAGQITLRLNITTDTERTSGLLEGVVLGHRLLGGATERGSRHFLLLGSFLRSHL